MGYDPSQHHQVVEVVLDSTSWPKLQWGEGSHPSPTYEVMSYGRGLLFACHDEQ